jgi:hypothetical protein
MPVPASHRGRIASRSTRRTAQSASEEERARGRAQRLPLTFDVSDLAAISRSRSSR